MSLQTPTDIPVQVIVPNDSPSSPPLLSAERRVTPSWTVSQLKSKLEPITGIPAASQSLRTKSLLDGTWVSFNDEDTLLSDSRYGLRRGSEIEVLDLRPKHERQNLNFLSADLSSVEKYQMPESQYERLDDSVLAWKRRQKLGRFDPHAKSQSQVVEERRMKDEKEIQSSGVKEAMRCRVGNDDGRRGVIRFTGEVLGLGGQREEGCLWVGVELDEPVGRNDGTVIVEISDEDGKATKQEKRRVFECQDRYGVLVRPEKVEVGDFPPLDDLMDEDMEEI